MSKAPKNSPWLPAAYDDQDTMALKALAAGNANESQQKYALNWIINRLCGTYDQPYRPESDRDTIFACAKQFVGQQIVKQINLVTPAKTTK